MENKNQSFDRESLFNLIKTFSRRQEDAEKTYYEEYEYNVNHHNTTGMNGTSLYIKQFYNFNTEQAIYSIVDDVLKNTKNYKHREMTLKWSLSEKQVTVEMFG